MIEKLQDALSYISDRHIAEAAKSRKQRKYFTLGAIAAVLVIALTIGLLFPFSSSPQAEDPLVRNPASPSEASPSNQSPLSLYVLSEPAYPVLAQYPKDSDEDDHGSWWADQRKIHGQPLGYADSLDDYFSAITAQLLTNTNGSNVACSPVNIYIALAMLAETTDGTSRQQILDLLNADNIQALRTQVGHVWRGHYNNDGVTTSILANSLWLERGYNYNEDTVRLLAESYYASVFQGDLGSKEINQALQDWINDQTNGLLREQAKDLKLDPSSVLALVSTLHYQVQWTEKFQEAKNTENTFHGANGDSTETFMNQTLIYNPYYWGDRFGAIFLNLEDGGRMWLILPDEGTTPEQLLESGEATEFLRQDHNEYTNQKTLLINLSVPKFDISSDMELRDHLQSLGIADVFIPGTADFSPIIPTADSGYVGQIKHAARVAIDEKGATAAAFTVIDRCGAGMPPSDEMDLVLDRPFFFVIESQDGLPLFTGIVNQP